MASPSEVAEHQRHALDVSLDFVRRHDDEAYSRIEAFLDQGARKWSVRGGVVRPQDELLLILAEAVAVLAKRVEELEA
jgi:hypothetical protein